MIAGAIVLAAGRSTRMKGGNKLLEPIEGATVVRHTVMNALAADLPTLVVVGHQADAVRDALGGLACAFAMAPDHAAGQSASLRTGLAAAPADWDAALVLLGDMPAIPPSVLRRLVARAEREPAAPAFAPYHGGMRGQPVLWRRARFQALMAVEGDQGGRALLAGLGDRVGRLDVDAPGVLRDADTPDALDAMRRDWPSLTR